MPARIEQLIDKVDGFEMVRDQIAAILAVESAAQEARATAASRDASRWRLRVYLERSNPWHEWQFVPDNESVDATPIVNVSYESGAFPPGSGNVVEQQKHSAVFNIDCYGYGKSADVPLGGHSPGDELASLEAHRALRLVRNILMSAHYIHLGLRGVVSRRWPQSINVFQPASDGRTVQHVVGARLSLAVDFNEYSPQVQGAAFETLSVEVTRSADGLVLLRAQYPDEESP